MAGRRLRYTLQPSCARVERGPAREREREKERKERGFEEKKRERERKREIETARRLQKEGRHRWGPNEM